MNTKEAKTEFIDAVNKANSCGARIEVISDFSGISSRTIQRWQNSADLDKRKGSHRLIPHKLTDDEKDLIIQTSCNEEFKDLYPSEIVAKLAENGTYIASEASFYRVLKEYNLLSHRRKSKPPTKRDKPRLSATKPDQVYSWDITWIRSDVSGMFYYLYFVMDIFSRMIVHWELHENESSEKAAAMLQKLSVKKVIRGITLHSDNGSPMKGYSMLGMMNALNVTPSFSRPRVSTDNPYSESLFRTLKYRFSYPGKFSSIQEAEFWIKGFVGWYNNEHLHSGISFVTPHDRHYGKDKDILKKRRITYMEAYMANPGRWSRGPKLWQRKMRP